MGGKHLKRLRAEKSKVQLKKKKTLPKGQNVTDTAFTVKKLVTIEQLKKVDENEPVSNWNVPLKDLLIHLNHYNFTSRLNGLNGIKELLTKYPDIVNGPSLKNLICRVLELLTDEEHKIRTTALELLSFIFDLIPPTSIAPFHEILGVHLGCVMTHRNSSVQRDSLNFIDFLIKYAPDAIKQNFKSVSQNFIRILRSHLFESHNILSKAPKNIEKLKTDMLIRFHQFLKAGLSSIIDEKPASHRIPDVNFMTSKTSLRGICDLYKKTPDLPSLFKGSEITERILTEFDPNEFELLCSGIISMLFETWFEHSPELVPFGCVMSEPVGDLLSVTLKIILLLYIKAVALKMESWFLKNYATSFQKAFTIHFPYLPSIPSKKTDTSSYSEFSGKGWMQNLLICYLSYSLKIVPKNSPIETKMEDFLTDALMSKNPTEIELVSKLIEVVLDTSKKKKNVLSKIIETYDATKSPELKQGLLKILLKVILKESNIISQEYSIIMNWMKTLPEHLCEPQIHIQEVDTILKLITKHEGSDVLKKVEALAGEIMRNLPNIKIEGVSQVEGQKMIVNILFRCRNEILDVCINILDEKLYSEELRNYIRDVFSYKFDK